MSNPFANLAPFESRSVAASPFGAGPMPPGMAEFLLSLTPQMSPSRAARALRGPNPRGAPDLEAALPGYHAPSLEEAGAQVVSDLAGGVNAMRGTDPASIFARVLGAEGLGDQMVQASPAVPLFWRHAPEAELVTRGRSPARARTPRPRPAVSPVETVENPFARAAGPERGRLVRGEPNLARLLRDRVETAAQMKSILGGVDAPLTSDEALLALEALQRRSGLVDPAERAIQYAQQLLGDVSLSENLGLVTSENRDFYPRAHRSWLTAPGEVGRLGHSSGALSAFTEDALSDPNLINLFAAMSVPYSAQATPRHEANVGLEMIPYFLEQLHSNPAGGAQGAMFGTQGDVPTGAAWGQPGTYDPSTGRMTRWGKAGSSLFPANRAIASLIDEQPGRSPMKRMIAASKWFERPQALDELRRLQGKGMLENPMPWAQREGGNADVIPQSLIKTRLPHWPEGKFQTDLPGWFLMSPKKGPYAEAQARGDSPWAVFDEQAVRGLGMRLGGNFTVEGDPISDADLADLIERVAEKRKLGKPWSMEQIIGGPKNNAPEMGKRVMVRNSPGGIDSGEREFYQSAMANAAKELGMNVGQVQAIDWFIIKHLLELAGSATPFEGGVAEGHADVVKRTRETGTPFVARGAKVLAAPAVYDYQQKGKFTPEQADAAARRAGYADFATLKSAIESKRAKAAARKAAPQEPK